MELRIVVDKESRFEKPVLIEGFRGSGMVSNIASHYISTELKMERMGHFESDILPPVAVVHENTASHPFRIYQSQPHELYLMTSEFRMPRTLVFPAARTISDWAKVHDVGTVVSIEGVKSKKEADNKVYAMTNDPGLSDRAKEAKINVIDHGMIGGISGTLLLECTKRRIPTMCILIRTREDFSDARAAAHLIMALDSMYGWGIDAKPLLDGAKRIEDRLDQVIHEVSQSTPEEPSMFR